MEQVKAVLDSAEMVLMRVGQKVVSKRTKLQIWLMLFAEQL